jgi:hypothetical protein
MKVPYASSFEEDGYLDDGDLPSLTPKGSASFGSHNAASKNGNPPDGSSGRRQFWDQLDVSSEPKEVRFGNGNRNHMDDDGPDDEMAARRALNVNVETKYVRSFESDNSAPTENESQLTEEIEEEPYETSFCGQTLNAIDDMCGGNLNLTGDRPDRSNKRPATTSPPIERQRHGAHSPLSSTPRSPNTPSETQQENTAIEVEFVEPIQSAKSTDSQGGSDSHRKNLRLNAIAKKAKENFRNKMGRKSQTPKNSTATNAIHATASTGSSAEPLAVEATAAPEQIESPVVDDAGALGSAMVAEDAAPSAGLDQDYNTFNATEKRKFIKLINSGVTSTVATHQILEDRLHNQELLKEPVTMPTNLYNEGEADRFYRDMDEVNDVMAPEAAPVIGHSDVSDEGDSVSFQKSGSRYYDALRKDVDDDQDIVEISSRGSSGFKGLELGAVQRFFQAGKPKGFTALPDTPDRRSISAPRQRLMEEEGFNPLEPSMGSDILESEFAGSLAVNSSLDKPNEETLADVFKNNSFDSLIRQRVARSPEDISLDATGNDSSIHDPQNHVAAQPAVSRDIPITETRSFEEKPENSPARSILEPSPPMLQRNKSVDSALNSTMETAHHNDAMSVYTAGTSATGATSLTQSSRVRRPGVAKVRLAKQKEIEQASTKKRQGWHETIRVAAESTNRTWDPKKGWVDYAEPDMVAADFDSKREPIKIDLSRSVLSHKETESKDKSSDHSVPAAPIPFPEEWEKERESMIRSSPEIAPKITHQVPLGHMVVRSEVYDHPRDVEGETVTLDVSQLSRSVEKESQDESHANVWVESMRAASAALAKEGMTWDPNYGWQRTTGDGSDLTDTVGRQISPSVEIDSQIPDTVDFDALVPVSNDQFVSIPTPTIDSVNLEEPQSIPTPTVVNDPIVEMKAIAPVTTKDTVHKTRRWFGRRAPSEPSSLNVTGVESLNDAAIPGVVLTQFDSRENLVDDFKGKEGSDPFVSTANGLPDDIVILETGSDGESNRNVVEVVKLKVDGDDLELFPRIAATPNQADTTLKAHPAPWNPIRTVASVETNQANVSVLSNDPSSVSSRRGAGPVDTDEVDETWDSDDEERRSKGWLPEIPEPMKRDASLERHHIDSWKDGALNAPSYAAKAVSSSPHGNNASRSAGSGTPGSSDASPSKKIPRLQRSKRDTSPLSLRSNLDVVFPRSIESIQRHENVVEVERTLEKTDPKTVPSHASSEDPMVSATKRPDPVSPNSNLVQARLKEWESRIESSHSTDAGDAVEAPRSTGIVPSVVAGWKSFLSKKMEKETAIAPTKEVPETKHALSPVPLKRGKPSEDDTLFQFGEKPEVAALNLSDLSPIRANASDDDDDDDIATSVAYGPTEAQRKSASFLERLTECANPMMPTRPMCGGGAEDDTVTNIEDADKNTKDADTHRRSQSFGDEQPLSLSTPVVKAARTSSSSVVSEDFGAKTAFLDALAMKAAVAKPKRARRSEGGGSSVVSGGTDHSEQWQRFLERKKAAGGSPITSRVSDAQLSQAAERYASEKVEEIISKMSARSNTAPRSREVVRTSSIGDRVPDQPRSISAAEDLAAARVEAMMAALSTSSQMDEGEI